VRRQPPLVAVRHRRRPRGQRTRPGALDLVCWARPASCAGHVAYRQDPVRPPGLYPSAAECQKMARSRHKVNHTWTSRVELIVVPCAFFFQWCLQKLTSECIRQHWYCSSERHSVPPLGAAANQGGRRRGRARARAPDRGAVDPPPTCHASRTSCNRRRRPNGRAHTGRYPYPMSHVWTAVETTHLAAAHGVPAPWFTAHTHPTIVTARPTRGRRRRPPPLPTAPRPTARARPRSGASRVRPLPRAPSRARLTQTCAPKSRT